MMHMGTFKKHTCTRRLVYLFALCQMGSCYVMVLDMREINKNIKILRIPRNATLDILYC